MWYSLGMIFLMFGGATMFWYGFICPGLIERETLPAMTLYLAGIPWILISLGYLGLEGGRSVVGLKRAKRQLAGLDQ
jgi:hypothetical protein